LENKRLIINPILHLPQQNLWLTPCYASPFRNHFRERSAVYAGVCLGTKGATPAALPLGRIPGNFCNSSDGTPKVLAILLATFVNCPSIITGSERVPFIGKATPPSVENGRDLTRLLFQTNDISTPLAPPLIVALKKINVDVPAILVGVGATLDLTKSHCHPWARPFS